MAGITAIKLSTESILQSRYTLKGSASRFTRLLTKPYFLARLADDPYLNEGALLTGLSDIL